MNTYHLLLLGAIGLGVYLWGGLWLLTTIERWWNMRKRDRLR